MPVKYSRRRCLQTVCGGLVAPFTRADGAPTLKESAQIAALAEDFLRTHGAPGLSVAFAKDGKMVYQGGFGFANRAAGERTTPKHRFRIASVSKPFTSVAIYSLIEQGRLKLNDKVFAGLLGMDLQRAASAEVANITLHHLLTHTCGGWNNKGADPMFQNLDLTQSELIAHTIAHRPLDHKPGTHYAYSNFGYCVLGRVIERLSGLAYADFVRQKILVPCGISDMQIAGNTLAERVPNEATYYAASGPDPYSMNVRRMDSHGGWLASPTSLVQFLLHVDGFRSPPDILRESTLKTLTTPTPVYPGYASGFAVNAVPNWWHLGSLPGTTSLAVRTASGMCWAGILNIRGGDIDIALDRLLWKMARSVPAWKA